MADRTVSVALQLKTTQFKSKLSEAQQQTKRFGDDLQKSAVKNKQELNDVAGGLAKVGAAAALATGLAVKKFADFDKAMSNVRAATHATAGDMGLLKDAAIEAGAKTAFSATEAAGAIENLAKAGVSTSDILKGGLSGALDLAAAGELGVAEAAETAATAMTQFGLAGKDVPHIADLLAAAAGKAQGEVSDMAAALNQSGLVAAQMGLSIEETTGTLAAFASAGLLGSDAGTSFKTMLLQLANPSAEAAETMKDLGINAYDAQGAFVGIAPLAEQLKSKLSTLSQEQRDSTLATIFGSDAIRAANVLYKNGAQGVQDWTTKVNDAGYAAETAAIKQDNLRGDIEKLGGSIETALIQIGEGADSPLRGITQQVTAMVDAFGELPGPVKNSALAIGGITAVGGLAAGGLLKTVTAAAEAKDALETLGATGKRLVFSMGAVGLALGAAAVAYGIFANKNAEAERKADDLRGTLDEQTGAITGNTRAYVANELAQSGLAQKAKDLGLNLAEITDAALGNQGALDSVVVALDAVIASSDRYQRGSGGSASEANAEAARKLKDALLGTNSALTDAQQKQKLAAEGSAEHQTAQEKQAAAVKQSNVVIKEQTDRLKEQTEAAFKAAGNALSLRAAQANYAESLGAVNNALKDNGRGLSVTTEAGRANRAVLDEVASSANDVTESMLANGRSHEDARKNAENAKAEFVRVATRMGLNKKAAKALADQLIAIPPKATTNVTNNAEKAKAKVNDYQKYGLNALSKEKSTAISLTGIPKANQELSSWNTRLSGVDTDIPTHLRTTGIPLAKRQISDFGQQVDKTLGGIADEPINIDIKYTSGGVNLTAPSSVGRRATGGPGGPVPHGPGGTTDDRAGLYALSNDEWVIKASSAQKYGPRTMAAINAGRATVIPDGGFASGGSPGLDFHAGLQPTGVLASSVAASTHALGVAKGKALAKDMQFAGPGGPPGNKGNFRGKTLNARTINMVLAAERILGAAFHITQGSYSTSVKASGSTHAGGGVIDTNGPGGWGAAVGALRRVGFAAWHRTPNQGPWGHHIHAVAIGDSSASPAAKRQVQSFLSGGNGLGGRGMAKGGPVGFNLDQALRRGPLLRDQGGRIPPGTSLVQNNTGRDEHVSRPGEVRRIQLTVDQTIKAVERLTKSYDKAAERVNKTTDRIKDLVAQRNEFAAASASSFTGALFGQGTSAGDLNLRLQARANDAKGFRGDLIALKKKGLSKNLLAELTQSSDYGAANELAQMSPAQLAQISKSYAASVQATQQLQLYTGHTQFGAQIKSAQGDLKREQSNIRSIQKAISGMKFYLQGGKGAYILVRANA